MGKYERNLELVKSHLKEGENIEFSVFGAYETKIIGNDSLRNGIFIATESRIVFFAKKLMGYDLESFPFENISSIEQSKNLMGHTITFYASGNKASMKWISKGDVQSFMNYVQPNLGKTTVTSNNSVSMDIPSQIQKLSELKDLGILTENEFNQKKTELLSKM
jgi:hypothetical protein